MKYTLSLLLLLCCTITANAQSEPEFSSNGQSFDCYNCSYGNYDYKAGIKIGIGYGWVKEISSNFDLYANIAYNYWRHEVIETTEYWYNLNSIIRNEHLINIAIGERFHFLNKKKSSLYTGLNLNFQTYFNALHRSFALTAEPTIGWRRLIGSQHEFFTSIGYDKHLTSYNRVFKRHPGKMSLNMGFNFRIGSLGARRNDG